MYGGGYSGGFGAGGPSGTDITQRSGGPDPQAYRSAGGGPGWQRLRQRGVGGTKPPVIDGRAESRIVETHDFGEGERCFHQKFGPGTIVKIDGDNLTIEFDKAGTKRVVAGFVERT